MVTPHDLHHGLAEARRDDRAHVLFAAWQKHPERFPNGCPVSPQLPTAVWINKPTSVAAPAEPADQRALNGAQAGGAVNEVVMINPAGACGITPEGGTH
jgi:hypothetical protein